MIRRNALIRLHEALLARRADLRELLAEDVAYRFDFNSAGGDAADGAFHADSDQMSSRLVELDARELRKVEWVLSRMKKGIYGVCEGGGANCQRQIPIARLMAVPCTTFCINCERDMESAKSSDGQGRLQSDSWPQVFYFQKSMEDSQINVAKLERNLVGNWRD